MWPTVLIRLERCACRQSAAVTLGVNFGPASGLTGTVRLPITAVVLKDYAYGPSDVTLGTMNVPPATDVRSGVPIAQGVGSLAVPIAADVRSGVAVDATTGTAAIPAPSDVRTGTAIDATLGSCAVPDASDVAIGVAVDATVGTLDVYAAANLPSDANVRLGIAFGLDSVGVLDLPSADNVEDGITFDDGNAVGNLVVPQESDVRDGTLYGSNSTRTGTLDPGAGGQIPSPSDVRFGVATGVSAGQLVVPTPSNVRSGTIYDSPAQQKTGTVVVPSIGDVRLGAAVDVASTGGLISPAVAKVEQGTPYGYLQEYTGTLNINARANLPSADEVIEGTVFGSAGDLVGNYVEPDSQNYWHQASYGPSGSLSGQMWYAAPEDVKSGVTYGLNQTWVGTYDPGATSDYPGAYQVLQGVTYNNGLSTGTLVLPAAADIRQGTPYDAPVYGRVGSLNLPAAGDVRLGTSYDNATQTGTLNVYAEANLPSQSNVRVAISLWQRIERLGEFAGPSRCSRGCEL